VIRRAGENAPKGGIFPEKKARAKEEIGGKSATLNTTINLGRRKI